MQVRIWCQSDRCVAKRAAGDREAGVQRFPVGCSNRYFCDDCRDVQAWRFRRDFSAARQGILWRASLHGLTSRYRGKFGRGARLTERLVTLTVPELGTADERARWEFDAWPYFLRKWNEYICAQLGPEPIPATRDLAAPVNDDGTPFLVRELCHETRFFEWTQGNGDGLGHPHFHVWAFGPFVPVALIREWWTKAWERAAKICPVMWIDGKAMRRLIVDVRKVEGDSVEVRDADGKPVLDEHGNPKRARIDHELIKYLTKQWQDGHRVPPEVFAELFAEVSPKRGRQTSRSFAAWSVQILRECPTCGISHPRDEPDGPFRWALEPVPSSALAQILARLNAPPEARAPPPDLPAQADGWHGLARQVETDSIAIGRLQAGIRALSGFGRGIE